jgi:16S rRNA (cytosine1402-N4)-methyltransferase
MSQAFEHLPVMAREVAELFRAVPPGTVVDATVGGGGHAAAVLEANPHVRLLGIDRDPAAVEAARGALARFGDRAQVVRANFCALGELAAGLPGPVTGVLFDLGVSSPQLDDAGRGFSYRLPGPLDMRMDPSQDLSAAELVNQADEASLARAIAAGGETRFARRIARAVVAARPFSSTAELAEVVVGAIPAAARRRGRHPARRAFLGLRMAVNAELEALAEALPRAVEVLAPGGRLAVISYHSGEDRLVKQAFAVAATGGCTCPPGMACVCGAKPLARLLGRRARRPSAAEMAANRRAQSARLRALERLADPDPEARPWP